MAAHQVDKESSRRVTLTRAHPALNQAHLCTTHHPTPARLSDADARAHTQCGARLLIQTHCVTPTCSATRHSTVQADTNSISTLSPRDRTPHASVYASALQPAAGLGRIRNHCCKCIRHLQLLMTKKSARNGACRRWRGPAGASTRGEPGPGRSGEGGGKLTRVRVHSWHIVALAAGGGASFDTCVRASLSVSSREEHLRLTVSRRRSFLRCDVIVAHAASVMT